MKEKINSDYIALSDDIIKYKECTCLRELGFVYAPTTRASWLYLVSEAWQMSGLPKVGGLQQYLTMMLERSIKFSSMDDLYIGLTFYQDEIYSLTFDKQTHQQLADTVLLYSSLFSGHVMYRHFMLKRESLIKIGESLYHRLWKITGDLIFKLLSDFYTMVIMVLSHVRKSIVLSSGLGSKPIDQNEIRRMQKTATSFKKIIFQSTYNVEAL